MEINGIYQWIFGILYPLSYWIYGILGIFQPYLGYTMVYNHIFGIYNIFGIYWVYTTIFMGYVMNILEYTSTIFEIALIVTNGHIWDIIPIILLNIWDIGYYLGYYGIYHIWNIFNVHITDHIWDIYTHYQSTPHIVPLTSRIQWTSKMGYKQRSIQLGLIWIINDYTKLD